MKTRFVYSMIFAIGLFFAGSALTVDAQTNRKDNKTKQDNKTTYVCPMHTEVSMNTPGKCTKCGMDLVNRDDLRNGNRNEGNMNQDMNTGTSTDTTLYNRTDTTNMNNRNMNNQNMNNRNNQNRNNQNMNNPNNQNRNQNQNRNNQNMNNKADTTRMIHDW